MKVLILLPIIGFLINSTSGQSFGKCHTPDQYRGDCVYFKSCPPLAEIVNNKPISNEDRMFLSLSRCGFRDGQTLVCCREQTVAPPPPPLHIVPQTPNHSSLLPKFPQCGSDSADRIYGGNLTKVDEYPWMALLQYSKPRNQKGFHCGGVLINSRYVLTASHCVNGKDIPASWSLTSVRLGEWDTSTGVDCDDSYITEVCNDAPVDVPIERKIPHENYNPNAASQHNDIALLRLAREVPTTTYISPICLPLDTSVRNNLFDHQTLSASGWGATEDRSASIVKLKVNVDGMPDRDCQRIYSEKNRDIISSQICAGGKKGIDTCTGDSGGPLMRQNENPPYWYLVGVVSFGPTPCGQEGWPGVYTRVGNFIPWIEANLQP